MAGIQLAPETAAVKRPFFLYVRAAVPYALFLLLILFIFATSDLPFMKWFPGKDYLLNNLVPYLSTIFAGLKNAFSSRYVSLGLLISICGGLLFLADRLFSRRFSV